MTSNIKIIEVENPFGGTTTKHVIIDRGNGEFTSMPKSEYDKQQAEQSTPIETGDE
jgi:hypothetical protein